MIVAAAFRHSVDEQGYRSFLCILRETAAAYGFAAGEMTYAEAGEAVQLLESGYRQAGFGPGHRVGKPKGCVLSNDDFLRAGVAAGRAVLVAAPC